MRNRKTIELLILELLYRNTKRIMAQIDDLSSALTQTQADLATLTSDVAAGIVRLEAAIAAAGAANPGVDLTAVIAQAQAIDASVKAVDASVNAATNQSA